MGCVNLLRNINDQNLFKCDYKCWSNNILGLEIKLN